MAFRAAAGLAFCAAAGQCHATMPALLARLRQQQCRAPQAAAAGGIQFMSRFEKSQAPPTSFIVLANLLKKEDPVGSIHIKKKEQRAIQDRLHHPFHSITWSQNKVR
jgi:hypothetical protein